MPLNLVLKTFTILTNMNFQEKFNQLLIAIELAY